ncbi:MAG: YqaJ viral recombinase family protein [Magnetococcales bacterium]|nr:YqaJ viral recombinase family protein [Magnetococcales bacterium]
MEIIPHSQAWLDARRTGIGGSDIAALLGLHPYKTPTDVYLDKTGQAEHQKAGEAAYWGTVLENIVAQEFADRTGKKIQRVNQILIHPSYQFAIANIDRAIVNPDISGTVRWKNDRLTTDQLLECKTANAFLGKLYGDEGSDEIPWNYLAQCQWYMGVTGATVCHLAVLIGGQRFKTYMIERNDQAITDMIEVAAGFWKSNVQAGVAPDPSTCREAAQKYGRHITGKMAIVGVEIAEACMSIAEIQAQMKTLEREEESLKLRVMMAMGDAEVAAHMGKAVATWKTQIQNRLDLDRIKQDNPEFAEKYKKPIESRVFRLKK